MRLVFALAILLVMSGCSAPSKSTSSASSIAQPPWTALIPTVQGLGGFGAAISAGPKIIAVGAPQETNGNAQSGSVYLFEKDAVWNLLRRVESPDPLNGARFGAAVLVYNGHLIVGAPGIGKVYAWDIANIGSSPQQLRPQNIETRSTFGQALAPLRDGIAVSDPVLPGVFVFNLDSQGFEYSTSIMPPSYDDSQFGWAMAGNATSGLLLVSSPTSTYDDCVQCGAVYQYGVVSNNSRILRLNTYRNPENQPKSLFGFAVALGTGIGIGAPAASSKIVAQAGLAFVFSDQPTTAFHTPSNDTQNGRFGSSIDLESDSLLVGSPASDGAVQLYQRVDSWKLVRDFTPDASYQIHGFGTTVAFSSDGSYYVVGSDSQAGQSAPVFIFPLSRS